MATYGYTFQSGDGVTPTRLNDARTVSDIVNADIKSDAAIDLSKLATGSLPTAITVASANLVDGTIVNADINASAAIAGTKIDPNFGSQNAVTTGNVTAAKLIPTGTSATGNGMYLPAANTVAISTNGSEALRIGSSQGVSIGTTTAPSGANAPKVLMGNGNSGAVEWLNASGAVGARVQKWTDNNFYHDTYDGSHIWRGSGFVEQFRVDQSGNLMIGMSTAATSSAKTLHLANATAPTANPSGGGVLFVEAGALKYRGSSGTVTTIASA